MERLPRRRAYDALQPDKRAAADEQDVGGIHRSEFLVRMLASALRWNIGNRAFQDLQQCLLYALAGDIARDGRVLVLAANLVNFVDINDAGLRSRHIAIGGLQQLQDDVFDVLTHIAGFRQRRGVHNGKGNIEHLGQGLRQQRLTRAGRPDQHDVRLGEFHFAAALPVHVNALVMVVNRYRQASSWSAAGRSRTRQGTLSPQPAWEAGWALALGWASERSSSRMELQTATHSSQM
jgi:hypothetical protein